MHYIYVREKLILLINCYVRSSQQLIFNYGAQLYLILDIMEETPTNNKLNTLIKQLTEKLNSVDTKFKWPVITRRGILKVTGSAVLISACTYYLFGDTIRQFISSEGNKIIHRILQSKLFKTDTEKFLDDIMSNPRTRAALAKFIKQVKEDEEISAQVQEMITSELAKASAKEVNQMYMKTYFSSVINDKKFGIMVRSRIQTILYNVCVPSFLRKEDESILKEVDQIKK